MPYETGISEEELVENMPAPPTLLELGNRFGKFTIHNDLLSYNPRLVAKVLSGMIVVRAEQMYAYHSIEYEAWSDKFDVVPMGVMPTEYRGVVGRNADGTETYTFEKVTP